MSFLLHCGDCLDPATGLASLADKSVDALVTDPPYGVDLGYESYDDTPENFDAVVVPAVSEALKKASRGLVFVAGHMAWRLPVPTAIGGIYLPAGSGRHRWGYQSFAHCLLYGQAPELQKGARPTGIMSSETADKSIQHPCAKPIGWMLWAVRLASRPGDTVLDPFAACEPCNLGKSSGSIESCHSCVRPLCRGPMNPRDSLESQCPCDCHNGLVVSEALAQEVVSQEEMLHDVSIEEGFTF